MQRWSPEKRAIMSTAALDEAFADEQMRRQLNLMDLAARKKAMERSLTLGERRLDLGKKGLALETKAFKRGKKQRRLASLIGVGEVGVSGLMGYAGLREARKTREMYERLGKLYGG